MSEKCFICDSDRWSKILEKEGKDILICRKCGLIKYEPYPSQKELSVFYANQYRKDANQDSVTEVVTNYEQKRADDIVPLISNYISASKKTLDIGSSSGILVKNISQINPKVKAYGLELNTKYRKWSIENENLDSRYSLSEPLENCISDLQSDFDVITLVHVLEHLSNPLETIKNIYRILAEGGILYVEVPNTKTPYGDTLNGYFPIYHLSYFSSKNLVHLLQKVGFEIEKVQPQGMNSYKISIGIVAKKIKKRESEIIPNYVFEKLRISFWLRLYFFLRQTKLKFFKVVKSK